MKAALTLLALWFAAEAPQGRLIPARRLAHLWQLAKDRELVRDFPPHDVAEEMWALGCAHVNWLEGRLAMCYAAEPHWAPHWREWERDARWCLRAWSLLNQSRNPHNTPCERANALNALESHLGYEDFIQRRMPPPMPSWWFSE